MKWTESGRKYERTVWTDGGVDLERLWLKESGNGGEKEEMMVIGWTMETGKGFRRRDAFWSGLEV